LLKILAINDGTFPALLKTLSDPSEAVVLRDLHLLSQISKNSDDTYFSSFMVNLLKLFATDRRLLETRGNLVIRQLCMNLSPERIYKTMADCLEKDEVSLCIAVESSPLKKKRIWNSRAS
jgi:vacuole morphology and inheritance protein 14